MIPPRWFPHSRFRHDRHDTSLGNESRKPDAVCLDCHGEAPTSELTADILLPKIETCQECHVSSSSTAPRARADCVECHGYHHASDRSFD